MADISVDDIMMSFPSRGIMVSRRAGGTVEIVLGPGAVLVLTKEEISKIITCAEVPA